MSDGVEVWLFVGLDVIDDAQVLRTSIQWVAEKNVATIPLFQAIAVLHEEATAEARKLLEDESLGLSKKRRTRLLRGFEESEAAVLDPEPWSVWSVRLETNVDFHAHPLDQGLRDGDVCVLARPLAAARFLRIPASIDPQLIPEGVTTWGKVKQAMADKENAERSRSIHMEDSIYIGRDNYGDVFKGRFRDITKSIEESSRPDDLKAALDQLESDVQRMVAEAAQSKEDAAKWTYHIEEMVKEALKEKPTRSIWEIHAEGLKEAAKTLRDIGPMVLASVDLVVRFLTSS